MNEKVGNGVFSKLQYHPVYIAHRSLEQLDAYIEYNNKVFLKSAEKYANKLLELSQTKGNSLYFPYSWEWKLHGIKGQVMKPDWYSGMAQGDILSILSRLYRFTKKKKYMDASKKVFSSFFDYRGKSDPWIMDKDESGYIWIEEYPMDIPCRTLNGFIFGIFGLYDYFLITKNKKCEDLINDCIETVEHYIPRFRNERDVSYYCLKHKQKSVRYHKLHIEQLNMLYMITNRPSLKKATNQLIDDYYH